MSTAEFTADSLGATYAYLDELSEALYVPTVTHPMGELEPRVAAVLLLRRQLLAGCVPEQLELAWPAAPLADELLRELVRLDLPRFCRNEPALVDAILLSVLELLGEYPAQLRERLHALLRDRELELDESTREAVAADAVRNATQAAVARLIASFAKKWEESARAWVQLVEVFGELGLLLGSGWDLARGVLRTQGWLEIAKLRELMAQLPALQDLIRTLGRLQVPEHEDSAPVLESIMGPVRRVTEELRQVRSPLAPTEIRGVERSGELGRMLPSEAVLLSHPVLKSLWHARRAERALLTYRAEGVLTDRVRDEKDVEEAKMVPRPRLKRGPIVLCLDTSGSMAGAPSLVAKALTLEAARVAHAERRRCYLLAFSGPGQCVEHELALTPDGLGNLMAFLSMSFDGGTDPATPLTRAAAKVEEGGWNRADLLIISDGEFIVPPEVQAVLQDSKARHGLRIHGLLVARGDSEAMRSLCDPLHRFADWGLVASATPG